MLVSAIIAAGGRGARFGGGELKQLRLVAGRAILDRSVGAFADHPSIAEVIVALPDALAADPPPYLRTSTVRVVAGGERRQDSVARAFRAVSPSSDVIVIHDAARPFVTSDLIARTIAAAAHYGAAVAAVQALDTVKLATSDQPAHSRAGDVEYVVQQTMPREAVFLAQTPQAFRREVLAAALEAGERNPVVATDEAFLAERAGYPVRLVRGELTNIKITTPADMTIAESIARDTQPGGRPARTGRAGTGYDLHRLVEGRPLLVCGVHVASDRGAIGHSDADVGCHAIVDALFGAVGLGDIGFHFPDSDMRWKGASSLDLLRRAADMVGEQGYEIGNVDVTIVLEAPKLRDHIDAMRRAIAAAVGIDIGRVSVKAKTNEGVDAVGRGEAIAAHAVALVRSAGQK